MTDTVNIKKDFWIFDAKFIGFRKLTEKELKYNQTSKRKFCKNSKTNNAEI